MGITDADLAICIPYLTADGSTARCRGVTKKIVAIRLLPRTEDKQRGDLRRAATVPLRQSGGQLHQLALELSGDLPRLGRHGGEGGKSADRHILSP